MGDLCASRDTDSDAEITADFAHRAAHLGGARCGGEGGRPRTAAPLLASVLIGGV